MGGSHFSSDADFLNSAVRDVRRLKAYCGLTANSSLLDWGCGAGRLAYGIQKELNRIRDYHGVDVQSDLIDWCQGSLIRPGYRFTYLDLINERYNLEGESNQTLASDIGSVDVIYAYSVFSHMNEKDTKTYLKIIEQTLSPSGKAFVTCFVEEGVDNYQENPDKYGPIPWSGRLHCCLYSRAYFEQLAYAAGLGVDRFEYGKETDGQSLYVFRKLA
jgi:cyclopropane fatty-acyl-phospholipid synthase-like methyltransferase